jgi:hypothetical protein
MDSNGNGTQTSSREAARHLVTHARTLVQLEVELAKLEVRRKGREMAAGLGSGAAAAYLASLMVLFLLLGAAAGLATTLPVWESFLIVAGGLAILATIVGLVARSLLKKGAPPIPDQAIEEAKRTKEAVTRT